MFIPVNKKLSLSIPIPELEGCKIINAKHSSQVCVITVHKDNEYKKIVLKFNYDYSNYDYV